MYFALALALSLCSNVHDAAGKALPMEESLNTFEVSEEKLNEVIKALNAREERNKPLAEVINNYEKLWFAFHDLQDVHELTKRELAVAQSEGASEGKYPGKGQSQREIVKLHEKLQEAQAELASTYKSEASSATETLRLVKQVETLTAELENAKNLILRKNAELSKLRKTAQEVSVLQDELVRVRTMLDQAEGGEGLKREESKSCGKDGARQISYDARDEPDDGNVRKYRGSFWRSERRISRRVDC